MKKIIIVLIMIMTMSCSEKKEGPYDFSVHFTVMITNESGNDLLNPSFEGSYPHQDIKTYVVSPDGKHIDVLCEIRKSKHTNDYYIATNATDLGHPNNKTIKETIVIELNENKQIEIEAELNKTKHSLILKKLWYKGELLYSENIGSKDITIII